MFLEAWTKGIVRNSSIRSLLTSPHSRKEDDAHLPLTFGALHISRDSHLHEICGMDLDHPMAIEVIARPIAEARLSNACSRENCRRKLRQSLQRYLDDVIVQCNSYT